MNKNPCGGPENNPDLQNSLSTQVETKDGLEEVHIDMETGAVSYGPARQAGRAKAKARKKNERAWKT